MTLTLEQRIQESLAKFIAAKWAFLGTKRTADASGYERTTTSVAAQVNASENWNLAPSKLFAIAEDFC